MATRRCNTTIERRAGWIRSAGLAAFLGLAVCAATAGETSAGGADDEARILLRALSFDRALATRAGKEVVISVVYDGRASGSELERDGRVLAFRKLSVRTIAGLPMRVTSSDCSSSSSMHDALRGVDIVYLTGGAKECVRAVTTVTRTLRIASLASERTLVEHGVTIGVTMEGARPKLLVNLKASRAEGLDLASQMLQLAEVIK